MKKVQKQLKRALSMVLAFMMVVGMLSGCGVGQSTAPDTEAVQDTVTEVQEVILSSIDQKNFLLSAGETQQPEYETANGNITDVTVTPDDVPLVPYQYYTVTITLMANENESFAKKASISLNGVELKVKKWAKDKLVIEYTTLALPETVTTDEMAKVTGYGDTASKKSLGTAKVQALLDCELTLFSEDGKKSYMCLYSWCLLLWQTVNRSRLRMGNVYRSLRSMVKKISQERTENGIRLPIMAKRVICLLLL